MLFFVKIYNHKMLLVFYFTETFVPVNGENQKYRNR